MRIPSRYTRTFALAAALAALTSCAAAINPASIEAARTAARVKTALVNDPLIGTSVIDVRMDGTVVRLSGHVRSQEEADRAASVARSVSGVTAVDSQLRIEPGPAPPPSPIVPPPDPTRGAAYEFAELEKAPPVLAVGAGLGWTNPGGSGYGHAFSISPLIRLGSGAGFSPTIAFDWFGTTLVAARTPAVDTGNVRVRPLMAGVGYSVRIGRTLMTPSIVAGYAFNSLRLPEGGVVEGMPVGIDNSLAWRPGVSVWIDAGRRTSVNFTIGRVITSPRVTFVEDSQFRIRTLSADTTILSVGLAYTLF